MKEADSEVEMTCKELVELVTDYMEGALPMRERARFDAHLGVCPGCTEYLDQMRLTLRLTGRLNEESLHPRSWERLLDAFREWKRDR